MRFPWLDHIAIPSFHSIGVTSLDTHFFQHRSGGQHRKPQPRKWSRKRRPSVGNRSARKPWEERLQQHRGASRLRRVPSDAQNGVRARHAGSWRTKRSGASTAPTAPIKTFELEVLRLARRRLAQTGECSRDAISCCSIRSGISHGIVGRRTRAARATICVRGRERLALSHTPAYRFLHRARRRARRARGGRHSSRSSPRRGP